MGSITHSKRSNLPDGPHEELIRPSDWNADHSFSLVQADIAGLRTTDNPTHAGVVLTPMTWAAIEALSSPAAGWIRYASDLGAAGSFVEYTGSRWRPLNGHARLKNGVPTSGINNVEANGIVLQTLLPVNAWKVNDGIWIPITITKSGTTDTLTFNIRIGTAGTTSDTLVLTATALAATQRNGGFLAELRLESATSVRHVGGAGVSSYPGALAGGAANAVTISSAATNALYVTVTIRSSGTTDTVALESGRMDLETA